MRRYKNYSYLPNAKIVMICYLNKILVSIALDCKNKLIIYLYCLSIYLFDSKLMNWLEVYLLLNMSTL